MKGLLHRLDRYAVYPESVFALSILLFVISLALPGIETSPLAHKFPEVCLANYGSPADPGCTWGVLPYYWFGVVLLFVGWAHMASFQIASFAWLANPLAFLAVIFAKRGVLKEAYIASVAAILFGLLALDFPSLSLSLPEAQGYVGAHLWLGYLFWEASFVVLCIYIRALIKLAHTLS